MQKEGDDELRTMVKNDTHVRGAGGEKVAVEIADRQGDGAEKKLSRERTCACHDKREGRVSIFHSRSPCIDDVRAERYHYSARAGPGATSRRGPSRADQRAYDGEQGTKGPRPTATPAGPRARRVARLPAEGRQHLRERVDLSLLHLPRAAVGQVPAFSFPVAAVAATDVIEVGRARRRIRALPEGRLRVLLRALVDRIQSEVLWFVRPPLAHRRASELDVLGIGVHLPGQLVQVPRRTGDD